MWPFSGSYLTVVEAKCAARSAAIAKAAPAVNSSEESSILKATASQIVANIQRGEWTASQVVEAYITRAALAHATTNCLTEVIFAQARARAKDLDAEFSSTGKLKGPLHGVPVSFKDQFDIIGFDTSVGFTTWANKPATTNADLVQQFLDAGAVIIAKTNIPQTMFAFECCNPLWGRTTNPWNDAYTSGGSSGGEGALLAMDGSALGIGSDIGGSLRVPAAYCGIYSLKPATGRLSFAGSHGPVPGFEGIKTVVGPMGRCIDDLDLVCRTSFGVQGPNYDVAPIPYREVVLAPKLKFGFYTSDGYVKASPANKRAVLETINALRKEGHECVEIELPDVSEAFNTFVGLTASDGYKTMLSHLGPDPKDGSLFLPTLGPRLPWFVRAISTWIMANILGDSIFANTVRAAKVRPVGDYMKLVAQRNEYTKKFHREVWQKHQLDGIIAPVQSLPQMPHGGSDNHSVLAVATVLYNVLDFPAGCLPVTRVDPTKDQLTDEWRTGPGLGSPLLEAAAYRGRKPLYNPVAAKGMPVGIQLVGKKWEEEKVLAMMRIVDQALGQDRGFGPGSWDAYKASGKGT